MKRLRQILPMAGVALGVFSLAGCGGGGGGSTGGGSTTMGVYVTDAFDDTYGQVWVTLFKIEASTDGTTFQTVYDDPAGKTINVSRLVNSAEFLGTVSLPRTSFTKVRVTIDDQILLVPKAGGAGTNVPVDDRIPVVDGKSVITFDVTMSGQHRDLVVDFDLASFELVSGRVRPHIKRGDDSKFHGSTKHGEIRGTIANLTATGFDLIHGAMTIKVQIDSATEIFSKRTGAAATLANGQKVEVKGTVNPDSRTVLAASVRIKDQDDDDGNHHRGAEAEGAVASVNATEKSFVLTLREAENFHPTGGSVTVKTDSSTFFDRRHSGSATFADITVGRAVEATGTYDAATNTLTARRVEIR